MSQQFHSSMADELEAFLAFKHALGYRYARFEHTLRNFDRFVLSRADAQHVPELDLLILDWLAQAGERKPLTVACELGVIRQFCLFLRRRDPDAFVPGRVWAPQSFESRFLPHIFSLDEIHLLLTLTATLPGRPFRPLTFRTLILTLYCTGLRFGEALRLKQRDVDLENATFFIDHSKGKSRWVPFGNDLSMELQHYLDLRNALTTPAPDAPFFMRTNGQGVPVKAASDTLRGLFRKAGLKSERGRKGPRPYDFRHAFAVHRLTRWYHEGVDIQAHLPWLSAYMGHYDLLGTESYLTATPELLEIAAQRFEARFARDIHDQGTQAER